MSSEPIKISVLEEEKRITNGFITRKQGSFSVCKSASPSSACRSVSKVSSLSVARHLMTCVICREGPGKLGYCMGCQSDRRACPQLFKWPGKKHSLPAFLEKVHGGSLAACWLDEIHCTSDITIKSLLVPTSNLVGKEQS